MTTAMDTLNQFNKMNKKDYLNILSDLGLLSLGCDYAQFLDTMKDLLFEPHKEKDCFVRFFYTPYNDDFVIACEYNNGLPIIKIGHPEDYDWVE